jgi:hypothetical protein
MSKSITKSRSTALAHGDAVEGFYALRTSRTGDRFIRYGVV